MATKKKEAKSEKKVDINKLDDIPGFGPVSRGKLAEYGINNFFSLWTIMNNPTKIVSVTGMKKEIAIKALKFVRTHLEKAGLITAMEMTADKYYDEILKRKKLTLGCSNIDNTLRGGFETSIIHEIYGHEGAGKTQMLHTLAMRTSFALEDGGLYDKAIDGEKIPFVIYIDTENTFRPDRLQSILEANNLIKPISKDLRKKKLEGTLMTPAEIKQYNTEYENQIVEAKEWMSKRVIHWRCQNTEQLFTYLQNANNMIASGFNAKTIIIDSLTNVFRGKYIGRGTMWTRSEDMNESIKMISNIAESHKVVMIITSQVYGSPDAKPWEDDVTAYGGHIIGHASQIRIKLDKPSGNPTAKKNKFKIIKAAHLPNDETLYMVTAKGIENYVAKGADDE